MDAGDISLIDSPRFVDFEILFMGFSNHQPQNGVTPGLRRYRAIPFGVEATSVYPESPGKKSKRRARSLTALK